MIVFAIILRMLLGSNDNINFHYPNGSFEPIVLGHVPRSLDYFWFNFFRKLDMFGLTFSIGIPCYFFGNNNKEEN